MCLVAISPSGVQPLSRPSRGDQALCPLRGLLGSSSAAVNVLADIRDVVELARGILDSIPSLPGGGRRVLVVEERIDVGLERTEGGLHVAALGEPSTDEGGVEGEKNPRPALEDDGSEEKTDPEKDLERRDDRHRSIIVGFDKVPNRLSKRVRWLGTGRATRRGWLSRLDSRDQVRSGIGCHVEDRVDTVGEQGEGELGSEKPNKRHGFE